MAVAWKYDTRLLHTDFRKIGYKQVAVFLGMSAL